MPIRIEFPLAKTFSLVGYTDERGQTLIRRAKDGEDAESFITLRQATIEEAEARTGVASKRKFQQDSAEDSLTVIDDLNLDLLARQEVFWTLAGTDIEFQDGETEDGEARWVTLDFVGPNGYRKVKSLNQFNKWWKGMPPQWGTVIHACCVEVNPSWTFKS